MPTFALPLPFPFPLAVPMLNHTQTVKGSVSTVGSASGTHCPCCQLTEAASQPLPPFSIIQSYTPSSASPELLSTLVKSSLRKS